MGIFISNHSQVLLALWDGKPSTKLGGTASVVNYHLTGAMPGFSAAEDSPNLLADNENDLVYHIACSRDRPDGQPREGLSPLQTIWETAQFGLESGENLPLEYKIMWHRLEEYGRDRAKYESGIKDDGANLLEDAPDLELPIGTQQIAEQYKVADWLAIHFQKRISLGLIAIHSIAVLIGLIFILYSELDGLDFLVNIFLFAFLAGFLLYKIGERRQWHRKHLDYRALAEGLRVQFYWSLAGVIDVQSAEFAYDNFLQKQDVDLGWIRHVMRNVSLSRSRDQVPPEAWVDWVIEQWVGDEAGQTGQLSYYRSKEHEKARRFRRTTFLGKLALWVGMLIAVALAIAGSDMAETHRTYLLVLMGVFPLIAGVRDAYSHKKAEKELIKQYRFMRGVLANARRLLDSSEDLDFRRAVLRALGNAALEEGAEWLLMHRERPLEHSGLAG
jgi:general stress protein CsbA